MNNIEVRISPRVPQVGEQTVDEAILASQNVAHEQTGQNRIPLSVRTRRTLRIAPPIDDGFRPFRVF